MDLVIRTITLSDHHKMYPFWKDNYFVSEMDSYENFHVFLDKNPELSVLAEVNGEIVGSALGSFDGRRGYVQKVVVRKDYRRKGLGQQLVKEVIQRLRALHVLYIPIAVEQELVHFYENSGFKTTKQVPMNMDLHYE